MMAHQNPPYLAFCTPGQNETKNKIQGYQRETNKNSCYHNKPCPPFAFYIHGKQAEKKRRGKKCVGL